MLPTPSAGDHKGCAQHGQRRGQLGEAIGEYREYAKGSRLQPTNVEWMMGWPAGWTLPDGLSLVDADLQTWTDWPSHPWTSTESEPHRRPRLKACGNGVVAQVAEAVGRDIMESL